MQRDGQFMYGINHPMPAALTYLARQLADREFSSHVQSLRETNGDSKDYLSHIVWPVYPEIGDHLGVEGSYHWRVSRKHASLTEFIELCFSAFDKIELRKQIVNFIPSMTIEDDQLLRNLAGI